MAQPRLIAVSGAIEGRTFPLDHEPCTIGRQTGCAVQVLDLAVSRRHCELRRHSGDERWLVRDLESRHGTFVNGQPVGERVLEHGDVVQVGATSLIFLEHGTGDDHGAAAPDSGLQVRSTVDALLAHSLYLHPDRLRAALSEHARAATDLSALIRLSAAVHEARGVDSVAGALLDGLLACLPAERGCVLVAGDGGAASDASELRSAAACTRKDHSRAPFAVSRTVLARVLAGKAALLCTDIATDAELAAAGSMDATRVRSLLCAPLISRQRTLGVVYLDTASAEAFSAPALELCAAAAAIAALALDNTLYVERLRSENRRLTGEGAAGHLIGESPAMRRVYSLIERVAPSGSTVLIRGESGTGKELCARAIHALSTRAGGPFVAINCATLSDTLLQSELFGHEKGAFTGAVARKIGKIELAHQGTLFLDEIGELSAGLQARLLRVLQEREIDRVGGSRPIPVDVRVIAATNRDLEAAMRAGEFRDDLFYRLNVVGLTMPPLRERGHDIALLARHFARTYAERAGRQVVGLSAEARDALMAYDWPGNVRQLGNAIERALVLGTDEVIRLEDLPDEVLAARPPSGAASGPPSGPAAGTFNDRILATKRRLVLDAYDQAGGDHQRAAALLGIHANSLHRLIRTLGLKSELGK